MDRKVERRLLLGVRSRVEAETREGGKGKIYGHAAVYYDGSRETEFQLWDEMVERIMPGAFDKAIADGQDVRALFNHDADYLLGRTTAGTLTLRSDQKGLLYEIEPGDTTAARDVRTMIERGDLTGSSFSFVTTDEDWRKEGGTFIREIRGVDLYDVGPVTFPAYEGTDTGARGLTGGLQEARKAFNEWILKGLDEEAARRNRAIRARMCQIKA